MRDDEPTLVLVVDDDEFVRKSLGRTLRRLGCEVLLAAEGEEAIRVAVEAKPVVIFLDLRMPGMDGHTVLRRLLAAGVTASILVMSGQGDIDDVIEVVRRGAVDYMKKPWTTTELLAVLGRGIEAFDAIEDPETAAAGPRHPLGKRLAARVKGGSSADRRGTPMPVPSTPEDPGRAVPLGDIVQWLRSGDIPIPPSPPALTCLREWARAPGPPMEDVALLVEKDRDLAMTVLRLANSSSFARSMPVSDIRRAVLRVGLRRVHGLAETIALRERYHFRALAPRALHERIWRFSVARGMAMRAIADVAGPELGLDGDRCYLAGLVLDVGASFLLWTLDGQKTADEIGRPEAVAASTIAAVATYHAAFGQAILNRWGMSDIAALAGEHHHETSPATGSALWCAAVSAGPLASRLVGVDDSTCPYRPRAELLDRCAYSLGLGDTVLRRLTATLADDAHDIWAVYA